MIEAWLLKNIKKWKYLFDSVRNEFTKNFGIFKITIVVCQIKCSKFNCRFFRFYFLTSGRATWLKVDIVVTCTNVPIANFIFPFCFKRNKKFCFFNKFKSIIFFSVCFELDQIFCFCAAWIKVISNYDS